MDSQELQEHLISLADRVEAINSTLVTKGQYVASMGTEDAINGLRKTLSCWNHAITW